MRLALLFFYRRPVLDYFLNHIKAGAKICIDRLEAST